MSRPFRVSMVTETWPPEINGVAMTVSQLVFELSARGNDVELVRPRQPVEPALKNGAKQTLLVRGFAIPGYRELRFGAPALQQLRRHWQRQRPDVIYVATEGPLGWAAVRAAKQLRIAAVSGFHTQFHQYSGYYRLGWLQPLLFRYLATLHNDTACTLVPTDAMRRSLLEAIPAVEVLGRGIDCKRFTPQKRSEALRREWGAGPRDTVFLYVGRLAREKNIPFALDAFQRLHQRNPQSRLVLVGHGPDYSRLYARHEGLIFTGSKVGDELARYYASADIFLFPSISETFGNVVLEAMASGLGVVAFDDAAAGIYIRHGENGMLAAVGDEASWLRHCQTLLANEPYRNNIRRQARQTMEGIAWEQIGAEFERILRSRVVRRERNESAESLAADFSR